MTSGRTDKTVFSPTFQSRMQQKFLNEAYSDVGIATHSMSDFELKKELFLHKVRVRIDPRVVACELHVSGDARRVKISGFSMFPQTDTFVRRMAEEVFGPAKIAFDLKILSKDYAMAFYEVVTPAAPFYRTTLIKKNDLLTEALYGSVIRGFFSKGAWLFAQHADGYVGYVQQKYLMPADTERYLRWKTGECAILRTTFGMNGTAIPPAARLVYEDGKIQTPSGKWIAVSEEDVYHYRPCDAGFCTALQDHAQCFKDTPYLWGGKTHHGIDCSGFVQTLMQQQRILLPRDANMQAFVGEITGYLPDRSDLLPGDMLFFMNNDAHVFHVGIYLGDRKYLHSSGTRNVVISSFDPEEENYLSRYGTTFAFARRVRP